MAEPYSDSAKTVGDIISLTTVVGTLMQVLPSIAAIFTIIWTAIRIYETKTVQAFFKRVRG